MNSWINFSTNQSVKVQHCYCWWRLAMKCNMKLVNHCSRTGCSDWELSWILDKCPSCCWWCQTLTVSHLGAAPLHINNAELWAWEAVPTACLFDLLCVSEVHFALSQTIEYTAHILTTRYPKAYFFMAKKLLGICFEKSEFHYSPDIKQISKFCLYSCAENALIQHLWELTHNSTVQSQWCLVERKHKKQRTRLQQGTQK